VEPDFTGGPTSGSDKLQADYDVEGSDVGYRRFARKSERPLFPFGYGLSYTNFAAADLKLAGLKASFTVSNIGQRHKLGYPQCGRQ
jgi:beta-glucosidase